MTDKKRVEVSLADVAGQVSDASILPAQGFKTENYGSAGSDLCRICGVPECRGKNLGEQCPKDYGPFQHR